MRKVRKIRKVIIVPKAQGNKPNQIKPGIRVRKTQIRTVQNTSKPLPFPDYVNSNILIPPTKSNRIFIIGGGPSVNDIDLDLLENEDTMCINASINYVLNPTYFVTMDYSYFDPQRNINTVTEVVSKSMYSYFILNTKHSYITNINGKITDTRNNIIYNELDKFTKVINSNKTIINDTGFGQTSSQFAHGENSGFCGIQLATLLGYEEIYLIGFDLNSDDKDTHFHKKYSNSQLKNKINDYKNTLVNALALFLKNTKIKIATVTPSSLEKIIIKKSLHSILINKKVINAALKEKPYIIVSYYTINTPYEAEAIKLKNSLNKLNIPHDVVGVPNLGDWQANTRFKAKFMQDMLIKHKGKSIVWVDSDAVVHSYPSLFDSYTCDVAVRWQDFRWRKNECLSGTIYLANNSNTMELCKRWEGINIAEGPGAKTFEQWNLGKVIEDMRNEGKIKDGNLPPEYTMIFDSMRAMYPNVNPVIEHFQASRKLKNKL
tara:strand:+ start:1099 stop:2565 length:1467 start_codon:yes stop_codon:yes gene_type:complete